MPVARAYWTVILFMVMVMVMVMLSVAARLRIHREGSGRENEGLYSSLCSAPLFCVKLLVGGMSVWLRTKFMSADGAHHRGPRHRAARCTAKDRW